VDTALRRRSESGPARCNEDTALTEAREARQDALEREYRLTETRARTEGAANYKPHFKLA